MRWSWIAGFGRFWYHFIVGDDWTLAAAVAVGLAVSAALNAAGIPAWWLIPLLIVVMVGVSLRRARRAESPPEPAAAGRPPAR